MDDPRPFQHPRKVLADLDGNGADENGSALRVHVLNLPEHRAVFLALGLIDGIVRVFARDRFIGRNNQHAELVDVVKFLGLGLGSAGHAGELLVKAEIILNCDRR